MKCVQKKCLVVDLEMDNTSHLHQAFIKKKTLDHLRFSVFRYKGGSLERWFFRKLFVPTGLQWVVLLSILLFVCELQLATCFLSCYCLAAIFCILCVFKMSVILIAFCSVCIVNVVL